MLMETVFTHVIVMLRTCLQKGARKYIKKSIFIHRNNTNTDSFFNTLSQRVDSFFLLFQSNVNFVFYSVSFFLHIFSFIIHKQSTHKYKCLSSIKFIVIGRVHELSTHALQMKQTSKNAGTTAYELFYSLRALYI